MSITISVIMPSLNVAGYIGGCLESVLKQTYTDLEILFIDAGSTDGTLEIINEYTKKDKRIHLIHSEKKSYGYQINLGIGLSQGKYIGIVETDDDIDHEMYSVLLKAAEENHADYVKAMAEVFWSYPGECRIYFPFAEKQMKKYSGRIISSKEKPELINWDIFLWNGIYRRDFLKDIRLNETPGAAFQDQGFLLQTLSRAERAVYLDQAVYHYRQDNMGASNYDSKVFRYIEQEYALNDGIIRNLNSEWRINVYRRLWGMYCGRVRKMASIQPLTDELLDAMKAVLNRVDGYLKKEGIRDDSEWEQVSEYQDHLASIYEDIYQQYQKKRQKIAEWSSVIEGKDIVIFGSGNVGKFAFQLAYTYGVNKVLAYCDNDPARHGMELNGLDILSLRQAFEKNPEAYYLVANKHHAEEMKGQLISLGIAEERIACTDQTTDINLLWKKVSKGNR